MISARSQFGDINGLGYFPEEYATPASVWHDTYDADFDGEGYVGSCDCPHCGAVANHYNGTYFSDEPEFVCVECSHYSHDD